MTSFERGLINEHGYLISPPQYATGRMLYDSFERSPIIIGNLCKKRIGNSPGNYLKLTPFQHKTDGFFVAILGKSHR
jgi:16S rRNA C967 or C1407 C5-methylase (RsmB/RsmF family)